MGRDREQPADKAATRMIDVGWILLAVKLKLSGADGFLCRRHRFDSLLSQAFVCQSGHLILLSNVKTPCRSVAVVQESRQCNQQIGVGLASLPYTVLFNTVLRSPELARCGFLFFFFSVCAHMREAVHTHTPRNLPLEARIPQATYHSYPSNASRICGQTRLHIPASLIPGVLVHHPGSGSMATMVEGTYYVLFRGSPTFLSHP